MGGKSRAAPLIWSALGDVDSYVEPFIGSAAALLGRPGGAPEGGKVETVNDADGFLSNFWRAIAADPEAVARHADWPVNETDLSARHLWLVNQRTTLTERLQVDPDFYDAKIAGFWVWGACAWIGSGWCSGEGPWASDGERWVHLRDDGNAGMGINRKLPHLGDAGRGINRKLPHLGNAGRGIEAWFVALAERLRRVRVCCGDWRRVVASETTLFGPARTASGIVGVLLDPPYPDGFDAEEGCYSAGGGADVWYDAAAWAVEAGANRRVRVVLCGYAGTWTAPADWREVPWIARKGYASDTVNSNRERLWLSPGCLDVAGRGQQTALFTTGAA